MEKPEKPLSDLVKELPFELHTAVKDYIEYLLRNRNKKKGKTLSQSWAGGLEEYKEHIHRLNCKKKALECWSD